MVETIVSREEILYHETVFRGLLQKTKDTITKAVKDNLPPEVGQEVTDLVLNVRPVSKQNQQSTRQKTTETTIGTKVRNMLDADSKQASSRSLPEEETKDAKNSTSIDKDAQKPNKPAQLARNPSALTVEVSATTSEPVILKASNRPNTPKTNTAATVERKIGATKVAAVSRPGSGRRQERMTRVGRLA